MRVWLPSGEVYYVDRGIEQGDPLGPAYCGLVMGRIARDTRAAVGGAVVDLWYLDDGQLVLPAARVGAFLRAFDARAALDGMQRSRGARADIKSEVRVTGRTGAEAATLINDAYVVDSCIISDWDAAHKVLGAMLGTREAAVAHFKERAARADELREAIGEIGDPATELVLQRLCADVAKVNHLLRAGTVSVDEPALAEFDRAITRALSRCLGGGHWPPCGGPSQLRCACHGGTPGWRTRFATLCRHGASGAHRRARGGGARGGAHPGGGRARAADQGPLCATFPAGNGRQDQRL